MTATTGPCVDCAGTGVRQVGDPIDAEFQAEEPCARCGGDGRTLPDLAHLVMTRQAPREVDPCTIRFEERGTQIWANFFDEDGEAAGATYHLGDRSTAWLVAHYEERGWAVAEAAADGGAR